MAGALRTTGTVNETNTRAREPGAARVTGSQAPTSDRRHRQREDLTIANAPRIKKLERDARELHTASEILKPARASFAQAELDLRLE